MKNRDRNISVGAVTVASLPNFMLAAIFVAVSVSLFLRVTHGQSEPVTTDVFLGHWEGVIEAEFPQGVRLDVSRTEGRLGGVIGIPISGYAPMKLTDAAIDKHALSFSIDGLTDARMVLFLVERDLVGEFHLNGAAHSVSLGRRPVDLARDPRRPQTPLPPFPYDVKDIEYHNDALTLAGTLTIPKGAKSVGGVVLLPGSDGSDRDCSWYAHKTFLVLADFLTRAGFAVLRADSRGVGGSDGVFDGASLSDRAADALAAVAYLRAQPTIDVNRVGLIGFSEGGWVADLAATRSKDVHFIILLSTPARPGIETLIEAKTKEVSRRPDAQEKVMVFSRLIDIAMQTNDEVQDSRELDELEAMRRPARGKAAKVRRDSIERGLRKLRSKHEQSVLRFDPGPILQGVEMPCLAVLGDTDLVVDAAKSERAYRAALRRKEQIVKVFSDLNHMLQPCTDSSQPPPLIETTIDPRVLGFVKDWLAQQ